MPRVVRDLQGSVDGLEITVHDSLQRMVFFVPLQPMIGYSPLRPVVSPDLGRAIARTDHTLSRLAPLRIESRLLQLKQPRAKYPHGFVLVLVLALLVLTCNDETRRDMGDSHC